jgi:uncharacterized GH25 family protein
MSSFFVRRSYVRNPFLGFTAIIGAVRRLDPIRCTLFGLLAVPIAGPALAHDTWIGPPLGPARPGAALRLDLTSGGSFPQLDYAPEASRVARVFMRLAGKTISPKAPRRRKHGLEFSLPLARPGIASIAVSLKPKDLGLAPEKIHEYLEEIGALEAAGAIWAAQPEPKSWHETYSKHAKTFVRVGDPSGDKSWGLPAGLALEIVPEKDPTDLTAGDELPVRVLKNGAPFPGFVLAAEHDPKSPHTLKTTDAEGRAVFVLDRPGQWLLSGTDLRWKSDTSTWESDFTTLTLRIRTGTSGPH